MSDGGTGVARVAVDVPLAHLDRLFDYAVPDAMAADVRAGVRVRVRFAGRLVDGVVLERVAQSEHHGRLARLERVVSPEVVLTPEVARLARTVADGWGGVLADVLRLALPPRHARVEAEPPTGPAPRPDPPEDHGWAAYRTGPAFLRSLGRAGAPRAVWTALPGEDWAVRLAEAARVCAAGGRGALLLVPDARDLTRLDAALRGSLGPDAHVSLSAELGPAKRYRAWLRVLRGEVRVVAGTRGAVWAPVADLGLVAMWDDGDDLYAEPRAPYPHAREVLVRRAHQARCAAVFGAAARSVAAAQLLQTGWARELTADVGLVRERMPAVGPVADDAAELRDAAARTARLPTAAWRVAGSALAAGAPVLVQVPRRGYAPALACATCRAPARCGHCHGPLASRGAEAVPACRWCGRPAAAWTCPTCGHRRLRAAVVGARRTAEELGRAFPGFPVRTSGRDGVLADVPAGPALVVATPGAEPVAVGGYGAALLLDGWALLHRASLDATEETLRRWMNAATLVRPGGAVLVSAEEGLPAVQALIRWAPGWLAERELTDRTALGFPPAARFAAVSGPAAGVGDLLEVLRLPASAQVLGPVPDGPDRERILLRVPRADGPALARAVHDGQAVRSARKADAPVRVQLDPEDLL